MHTPLRVLIVEDSEDDCLLLKNELARGGYAVTYSRVETPEEMTAALAEGPWDIVVSDHRMPRFSSLAALKLFKERASNVPFIVVSGSIGEELAVGAMKAGAHDYIMKDNLARLVPAVERELREAESRRQRQNAEQALEQWRRRTESILEAAGEGICGLDANGVINFINPRGAKLIGWEAGELIGKPLHETVHHSRPDRTPFAKQDCSLCATLRDGLAHWMDDEVFWRKDGSAVPIEYTCMPMHEDDRVVGAVLTFQDITERKDAEGALREANHRLECSLTELRRTQQHIVGQERLQALGRMASGVAHDFNNALSKILGFTELLLTSPEKLQSTETVRDHLRMINTTARDAAQVVRRLHEFYRPRRDTELFKVVDLNAILEQTISLTEPKWRLEAQAGGVSIEIRTELQPKVLAFVDESELREVFTNLIFNAVDAMPEGGTITLRTSADAEHAILEISDTGNGMTEEVRRRCFEPFFTTKGFAGTGLGLASAYGIIQRHRGEIQIRSQVGKGTTFTIRLPAGPGEHKQPPATETPVASKQNPLRVLVVEDEPMVRGIEVEYLVSDGHAVETAADGCEGLSKFRAGKFDLVLIDRAMPEVNGDQLTEAIKELDPDMPVILVTGFTEALTNGQTQRRADLILSKPFSHAGLYNAVGKVMSAV
ncbi:MAG TPA: response regulator [Verrucomicrobiae bacterium]|nr:response regulator [Verrucomicrobiae bacterium]